MVTLGGTRIIAGCTLLVGRPSVTTPHHGDVEVSVSASPLSGPRFDLGGREFVDSTSVMMGDVRNDEAGNDLMQVQLAHDPTTVNAVDHPPQPMDIKVLESYLRRTLRSSNYISAEQLGISPGKAAWRIRITVHILNSEGNVLDASMMCILAALRDVHLPMVEVEEVEGSLVVRVVIEGGGTDERMGSGGKSQKSQQQNGKRLVLGDVPIPTTVAILSTCNKTNVLVVDPTSFEEDMSHGNSITVVCTTKGQVISFSKRGCDTKLSVEEMKAVMALGVERARELEGLVTGAAMVD
jgi:exosome complex component RRP43